MGHILLRPQPPIIQFFYFIILPKIHPASCEFPNYMFSNLNCLFANSIIDPVIRGLLYQLFSLGVTYIFVDNEKLAKRENLYVRNVCFLYIFQIL